jgi:RNA polymerase sigma factor (sigma-70 family)
VPLKTNVNLARFERIVMPHLDAAFNLARWLMRNAPDAEDVVQEAFLRALRFFESFHGEDGRPWLLAIVRNTCRTWRQRLPVGEPAEFDEEKHRGSVPKSGW